MRHIWSVLCSKSVVDKKSNNISLFEVLEEIHITTNQPDFGGETEVVVALMPAHWVSLWSRSNPGVPEKAIIKDTIKLPSGKILGEHESEINLLNNRRIRITRSVPVPPAKEEGLYIFETRVRDKDNKRWTKVSEVTLELILEQSKPDKV